MPAVVLFDIDGTLITTGGAGARSWAHAFERMYGRPADITRYSEVGMTDPMVARQTFRATEGRAPTQEELARLFAAYLLRLADEVVLSDGYRVLDGVEKTLRRLGESGALLGIVSGNLEGAARVKLTPGNLNRFFVFGGYGSDSDDRAELTRLAMDKAVMMHGHDLHPETFYVVGDTPRDIDAAKAVGAVSVGVATGEYSVEQLRRAGADHALESLDDPFPGMRRAPAG